MRGQEAEVSSTGSLAWFFLLTFAFTWTCFYAAAALWQGDTPAMASAAGAVFLLGVFGPSLVALALTAAERGRAGVGALLGRIAIWQVGARWYVFAVGFIVAIRIGVALLHLVVTGEWPRWGETPWYLMAVAIPFSTWVQAGEEIGWRGYALPRLTARTGLPLASLVLGVVWAAWHLPLFFVPGSTTVGQSFVLYTLQVTALSAAMAWLYWRTGGSLLLVMVMHAAVNNTRDMVPAPAMTVAAFSLEAPLVSWLAAALLWAAAACFMIGMRGARVLPGLEAEPDSLTRRPASPPA